MQQQVVEVNVLNQFLAAILLDHAQGTIPRWPARSQQCVERRREGADVIRPGAPDFAHHVYPDGTQLRQADIRGDVPELGPKHLLNFLLHCTHGFPAHHERPNLGKRQSTLPVHHPVHAGCHASPQVDVQPVSRAHHIIRPCREIHRELRRIHGHVLKNIQTKTLELRRVRRNLLIQIIKRGNVRIRVGAMDDRWPGR